MREQETPPKKHAYAGILLFSMVLLILIVATTITAYDYWTTKTTYEREASYLQNQTEGNIIQSVRILDAGFRLYDDSLNNDMKDRMTLFMAGYQEAGNDPSRMDLAALRSQLGEGYDAYIINETGIVAYTTYPTDLGLDFKTIPYFYDYLTKVRESEGFFSDRVVNELNTGMLRKFAYMPTPDHRYVFELGYSEPSLQESRSLIPYQNDLERIAYLNPYVTSIAIYDVEKHLVSDFTRVSDIATERDLDAVIASRNGFVHENATIGVRTVYLFVDLQDAKYGSDVSRVIRLTYDTSRIGQQLSGILLSHLLVGIGATVVAVILAILFSRALTRPIVSIVRDVDTIARGDLDHTISPTDWQEFRALEDSVNAMVRNLKRSLDKEREAEERYRNLVEATSDIIWEVSPSLTFTALSSRTRQVLGYAPEEAIGRSPLEFMTPDDALRVGPSLKEKMREGSPFSYVEATFLSKDGMPVTLEISGVPVPSPDGSVRQFRGVARDITRRRKAEEELRALYNEMENKIREQTAELRAAEETARVANMKLNLLGSVTRHDILNSLTIILGFIRFARQAPDDAARENAFRKIESAALKIQKQIAFSREYQYLGVKAPQWQGVSNLISRASQMPVGSRPVNITDETGNPVVFADPLLEKVFSNLIDNAHMHGGEGLTTIRFGLSRTNGDLVITCEDDGPGIPAENKERIFERGFGSNTGLGLFLCREILAITGMTIKETGEPGRGARFEIRIPAGKYRFDNPAPDEGDR